METTEQKELLRVLVTKLYQECGVEVEPLYPKMLIRILPREQKRGEIWLPEGSKQNKTTWEGVVLKVYEPFYQKIFLSEAKWVKDDQDPEARYVQKVECAYKSGDHILFPPIEFGQVPVWPLDGGVGDYRMIPENIVVGRLEYTRETTKEWLLELFDDEELHQNTDALIEKLLTYTDVIRKDISSKTLSGK